MKMLCAHWSLKLLLNKKLFLIVFDPPEIILAFRYNGLVERFFFFFFQQSYVNKSIELIEYTIIELFGLYLNILYIVFKVYFLFNA